MKWFKHDTDASNDAKIRKLILKYGTTGYAIYFHCLELIAGDVQETNITFELEHDAEIIADSLKVQGTPDKSAVDVVNEIMRYIIHLQLFEVSGEKITCYKLLKRLDTSMTSNAKMRKLIVDAKENHDTVMTESCKKRREEKRREEKNNNSDATDTSSEKDPESRAAASAEKELFTSVEEAFLSQLEDETQYSYPRERKHINKLIERVRNKSSPADFLRQAIETFYRLHTGRDKFWKKQPFLPSVLNSSGIWPRVLEEAKTDYVDTGVELWN